ncbi:ABC transporter ATP-binding protein/permease [Clostridium estertheticum]|uniref:ABC transporter ATP-binding protein n=1 Tax=Clostridium estertheticum TaxID=238834 RepID=UPI001C0D2008|nr:ABC transporter ATP-binding protein [Clostridium estertheticum]MBU3199947.1 ABC transporter ATP-binding protein/permease [Clostridium estertheticum]WAG66955.1 ABC transporter ATP-binding protein/permease [Clostridium estertheticum]
MRKNNVFRRIAIRYLPWMVVELIAAYVLTSIIVKGSSLISNAIDALLSGQVSGIVSTSFMMQLFLFVGIGFVASLVRDVCASQFSVNIQTQFREEAGRKLVRLEFKYFDKNSSGTILNKLISDIGQAGRLFSETLPDICRILVEAVTIIISIGKIDGMLVVFIAVGYPVVLVVSNYSSKRMSNLAKNRWKKIDVLNSTAYDNIQGILVGRSFNLMSVMQKKIYKANDEILQFEFIRNRLSAISVIMQNVINWLPNIILATLALMRVLNGSLTVGEMTFFILMLDRIIHPLSELPMLFNDAREIGVSIQRLEELMGQADEPSGDWDGSHYARDCDQVPETVIEFENVNFAYNEGCQVLYNVNFTIKAGKNVAFVGSSGEGKSTIFKLLCGFYKKQSGNYKLYGRNFEDWNLNAARNLYSLVSQNVFLFPESIADNIAYGREGATMEEIKEACRLANIHDFIISLPQQYDTLAGERGTRLSGGERQRISIARAFLKNAPILLLDEPTSAIDVGTEDLIKEAIERISNGKTVITIAHRLSTIENADTILVLSKGQIVESGTNEELLMKKGIYHHLYQVQQKAQEEGKEETLNEII